MARSEPEVESESLAEVAAAPGVAAPVLATPASRDVLSQLPSASLGPHVHPLQRRLLDAAIVGVAVLAGTALRTFTASDVWADEALGANIARLPLSEMFEALRHDGHPPLYYLLLHLWMSVFGDSDDAIRSLSSTISILALPVAWVCGRQYGGRAGAVAAVVLLATSPFAIRYSTEARMYALVILLVLLGWLAVRAGLERATGWRLAAVTMVSGLLLLTHYWAVYLDVAVLVAILWAGRWGRPGTRANALRVAIAVAAGALFLLPWLPGLASQLSSTGTPWAAPNRPAPIVSSFITGTSSGEAVLFGMGLVLLVALALLGHAVEHSRIVLDPRTRPEARGELAVITLTLALACIAGYLANITSQARYTAVVFPLLIIVAALGTTRLSPWGLRSATLVVMGTLGLAGGLAGALDSRTQAGRIAGEIDRRYSAGDVVVYCPDTLGPAVHRARDSEGLELTLPRSEDVRGINWADYHNRVARSDPRALASQASTAAGDKAVWLVWLSGYRGLGRRCETLVQELEVLRPGLEIAVTAAEAWEPAWLERAWLYRYPP